MCGHLKQIQKLFEIQFYLLLHLFSVVFSSIVCVIGPINPASQHWGQVEVEVKGGKRGTSAMYFTYRVNLCTHTFTL